MANTKVTGDLIASLTIATGNIANNAITSDKISGITTAHITEGANLYYTDARARAAVSVSGNALSYNSSTGVITSNFEESPTFTGNVVLNGDGNALKWTPTSYDDWTMTTDSNGLVIYNITDARYDLKISGDGNSTFAGNVGIGVAAHGTASLNITNTDQHIRLNNGSELGVISLDTDGKLDFWAHGTDETINFRTGTGSGTVTMSVVGGNVGIGTTSPSANLHVSSSSAAILKVGTTGVADASVDIRGYDAGVHIGDATNGLRWAIWNDGPSTSSSLKFGSYALGTWYGDAAQVVTMTSDGKVGIGVTDPEKKLEVKSDTTYDGIMLDVLSAPEITFRDRGNSDTRVGTGRHALDGFHIDTYSGNAFFIKGSNRYVGIGTTSPAAKLHVEGTIKLGGYSYIGEDLSDQDSLTIASDHTEAIHFAHFTPATSTYSTNMIIDNSGNVGIGTSSPTESKLVISGGATGTVGGGDAGITMINKFDNPDNSWSILPVITGVANTGFSIRDNTDSTDRLVINGSGNVGIGVNDPQAKLEVKGTSASPADGNEVISVTNTTGGSKLLLGVAENSYGWIQSVEGSTYRNLLLNPLGGNVGIGTTSPSYKLAVNGDLRVEGNSSGTSASFGGNGDFAIDAPGVGGGRFVVKHSTGNVGIGTTSPDNKLQVVAGNAQVQAWFGETDYTNAAIRVGGDNGGGGRVYIQYNGDDSYIDSYGGHGSTQRYRDFTVGARNIRFVTGNTSGSEKMRVTESGKTLIGTTSEQNAGTLQVQSGGSENGGTLDIAAGGFYRYYTRVCRNATSVGTAGYWHIKTNIAANSNTMFLAKFYGYIYGSAQILDLQHAGYAYSGTSTVINQGATNNGTDPNASSAVYISANGSKVTFRIAFGSGSNFSTYFAGVFMDMAFPSPAGQGHDFEIEAQSFSTSTTVY